MSSDLIFIRKVTKKRKKKRVGERIIAKSGITPIVPIYDVKHY